MVALLPPFLLVFSWALALIGLEAPGTDGTTPFDELALRWMLFFGLGMSVLGGALAHTVFARGTAGAIGWQTGGFQYEVGFASLGIGLAAIYASVVDAPEAWVAASIAGGLFLLLAGVNHALEIVRARNYAPGNTVILLSDLGVPVSLLALLLSTGALS